MQDKLDTYFSANRMHSFEGERGVRNMEQTMQEVCGYSAAWGGTLQNFFIDNPGAIEAVMEWIANSNVPEWSARLDDMGMPAMDDPMDDAYELRVGD